MTSSKWAPAATADENRAARASYPHQAALADAAFERFFLEAPEARPHLERRYVARPSSNEAGHFLEQDGGPWVIEINLAYRPKTTAITQRWFTGRALVGEIVDHEIAHFLHAVVARLKGSDGELRALVGGHFKRTSVNALQTDRHFRTVARRLVSEYGSTSFGELVAESYSQARNARRKSRLARLVHRYLIEACGIGTGQDSFSVAFSASSSVQLYTLPSRRFARPIHSHTSRIPISPDDTRELYLRAGNEVVHIAGGIARSIDLTFDRKLYRARVMDLPDYVLLGEPLTRRNAKSRQAVVLSEPITEIYEVCGPKFAEQLRRQRRKPVDIVLQKVPAVVEQYKLAQFLSIDRSGDEYTWYLARTPHGRITRVVDEVGSKVHLGRFVEGVDATALYLEDRDGSLILIDARSVQGALRTENDVLHAIKRPHGGRAVWNNIVEIGDADQELRLEGGTVVRLKGVRRIETNPIPLELSSETALRLAPTQSNLWETDQVISRARTAPYNDSRVAAEVLAVVSEGRHHALPAGTGLALS